MTRLRPERERIAQSVPRHDGPQRSQIGSRPNGDTAEGTPKRGHAIAEATSQLSVTGVDNRVYRQVFAPSRWGSY